MNWYYESAGQQQGPVSDGELDRLLADGKITPDTLVWREGLPGWAALRTTRPAPGVSSGSVPPEAPAASAPAPAPDAPPPSYIRCTATGKFFPPSEIIYIEGKPYSAEAKPQVLQSLQSGSALPGSEIGRNGPAWEQRDTIGIPKAILETIKGVLLEPSKTFATMKREGGLGSPLLYWILTGGIGIAISQVYNVFFQGAMLGMMTSMGGNSGAAGANAALGANTAVQVVLVFVMPVAVLIGNFIYAAMAHLSLKMLKGANQPFETTMRAILYTTGSGAAFNLVPMCGGMIGGLWAMVSLCVGLGKAHDTSTEKGVGGALLPMAACCLLYVGIIAIVIAGAAMFSGSK